MELNKKALLFMSIVSLLPYSALAGEVEHSRALETHHLVLPMEPAAVPQSMQSLANPVNNPIFLVSVSTASRLQTSGVRDNLPASPPFEATDQTIDMTAGTGAVSAPTKATVPAPLSFQPLQVTQIAETRQSMLDKISEKESMTDNMAQTPAAKWDEALSRYVIAPDSTGLARFDYAGLEQSAEDKAALREYIQTLEETGPASNNRAEAIVYWANLYNAVTILEVIENYPVSSIKEIKSGLFSSGPWKKDLVTVNGQDMSLDDIEHETLRKKYPSPLIHYMVNCASVGCPNLKDSLWKADILDADRDAAARVYVNSPRGAKVTDDGLVVSSIYKWFDEDFGGNEKGVLAHLSKYAEGDLKAALDSGIKIDDYTYDWSLNE